MFCALPQILGKIDAVWRHVAIEDAAEPFNILHMCPMSDDAVPNLPLSPYLCPAMQLFGDDVGKTFGTLAQILGKTDVD